MRADGIEILPVAAFLAVLLLAPPPVLPREEEIAHALSAGPAHYMLSKHSRVPTGGVRIAPYPPHLMFYAPYLRNADVGVSAGDGLH